MALKTTLRNIYLSARVSKGMNWQASQVVGLIILVFISAIYIALLGSTSEDASDTTSCANPMIQGLGNLIAETTEGSAEICN